MKIGIIQLHLFLPACTSLKEKRSRIKPLISRLHSEFNLSVAEIDLQDMWQEALIGCALINNDAGIIQKTYARVQKFTSTFFTEIELLDDRIEII
ncbi:MAG: DUF503 domain-containing protein [Anaerolineae bacterium]|nr:DUF503 domain-containing protein [Anaerolineae bacterium]